MRSPRHRRSTSRQWPRFNRSILSPRLTAAVLRCSVKEMDPGQIGLLIKVLNIASGLMISVWAGVLMVLEIGSYISCGPDDVDPVCCPTYVDGSQCPEGASMSLSDNFSGLVISMYMIPLGAILILYEISTRRVGAQEVREPVATAAQQSSRLCRVASFCA